MGRSEPFATSLQEQYTLRLFCSLRSKTARKVLRSSMHSLRSPAAHSIFKNPREMDVHACPPLAERIGGGAGAGTESNRTTPVQSHLARGARGGGGLSRVKIHGGVGWKPNRKKN